VDLLLLAGMLAFLADYFSPSLLLSSSVPAGGDTPSHFYTVRYLAEVLLPQGRISGWCPGALTGFPLLQYYFPLPFVLAAALGKFLSLAAGFKLATVAGTFLLPLAAWGFFRLLGAPFPAPVMGAALSLCFLFNEGNTMWGGNIPSTLAGEFCYSLSFALAVLWLGMMFREAKSGRRRAVPAAGLLALCGLCHAYPLLYAVFASSFFLFSQKKEEFFARLAFLARVHALAFLLLSFWLLPLLAYLPYTTRFNILWVFPSLAGALGQILPAIIWPGAALGLLWTGWSLAAGRRLGHGPGAGGFLAFLWLAGLAAWFVGYRARVVDVRFLPFFQFFLVVAGAGVFAVFRNFRASARVLLAGAGVVGALLWVDGHENFTGRWITGNYRGMEMNVLWPSFSVVNEYLAGTGRTDRVAYEHSMIHARAGTVRAFELLPLFSGRPTLESVYIQASQTAPFIYYLQSEISQKPSTPIPDFCYSRFNPDRALGHLALFNAGQVVAAEKETRLALAENPGYTPVFKAGYYQVFDVAGVSGRIVEPVTTRPVLLPEKGWDRKAYEWFRLGDLSVIPVFSDAPDPADEGAFLRPDSSDPASWAPSPQAPPGDRETAAADPGEISPNSGEPSPPPAAPAAPALEEEVEAEIIRIKNAEPGVPLLVKVSHHPAWKVSGAARIYRAGPGLMMVVPSQAEVTLTYSPDRVHAWGMGLTAAGLILALLFSVSLPTGLTAPAAAALSRAAPWVLTPVLAALVLLVAAFLTHKAPEFPVEPFNRGIAYFNQKDYAQARERFAEALSLHPQTLTSGEAAYHLAMCWFREGDWARTIKVLDDLLTRYPDSARAAEALYHKGLCLQRIGEIPKARRVYQETRDGFPGSPWAGFASDRLGEPAFQP